MEIHQQAAIITGGASGMGYATAKQLIKKGMRVALLDMNQTAVAKAAKDLNCMGIQCDVTQPDSVMHALNEAEKQQGPARVCINCAGIVHARRMINREGPMPLDEFRHVIEVNLIGTYNVMRLAANAMIPLPPIGDSAERGVIINTASVAAFEGQIGQTAYSSSKGGIVALTLPARELASFGIRIMTIAPGLVDTPMFAQLSDEARASLGASVPFPKRLAKPEEYAALALHIIENAMLNGEVIRLDGAIRMQEK